MKWLTMTLVALLLLLPTKTEAKEILISHAGTECQATKEALRKIHPTSHIYYEYVGRSKEKCFHVHVSAETKKHVTPLVIRKDVSTERSTVTVTDIMHMYQQHWGEEKPSQEWWKKSR